MAGQAFMRPGVGYRLDKENGVVHVNRILKWYKRDFNKVGGAYTVLERYGAEQNAEWIREHRPEIQYMKYDWGLNAKK